MYEIICLDSGSTPLTSTASLRGVQSEHQPRHVVKLPTRACLVLTDRGDKYIKHYTIN
nr:MAG TPA_asm: hypothetical protein [Bacteriophage sp.]